MSLLEEDSLASQLVDVGSLRLGMSSEATNPVVQVIDGDEQNVRPVDRGVGTGPLVRWHESDEECNRRDSKSRSGTRQEFRIPTQPKVLTTSATKRGKYLRRNHHQMFIS